MQLIIKLSFILVVLLLLSGCGTTSTTSKTVHLVPGMTYYDGPEKLSGKLVFLLRHDYNQRYNDDAAASIYKFDLVENKLTKLTDCPNGIFISSEGGNEFCVNYGLGDYDEKKVTNVFVYSESLHQNRIVRLVAPPNRMSVIDSGHAFFEVQNKKGVKLIDYNIASAKEQVVEFSDSSTWEYQDYGDVLVPPHNTNNVHFNYKSYGKRLSEGKDYPRGYYVFDINTGKILGPATLSNDEYDKSRIFKTFDGRFIFFEGSGSPVEGFKLVSSPLDDYATQSEDPKRQNVKVLHNFSRLPAIGYGIYLLTQMSPDGHYALVRLEEPTIRKSGMLPGFVNTYYLVDVTNGDTRILLKDETDKKTNSSIFTVYWVQGAE